MSNLNLKVIVGKTELAPSAYEQIKPMLSLPGVTEVKDRRDADLRLVLGGDGTAMQEARFKLTTPENGFPPIFGIKAGNSNSKGMLLNDVRHLEPDALLEAIKRSVAERFHYLRIIAELQRGQTKEVLSFNDVNTIRQAAQSAATRILLNNEPIAARTMGDGILVCTPQGSAAYNLKAGGRVATAMNTLQITGIVSSMSSLVVPDSSRIRLEVLEPQKRPQLAEFDGHTLARNIQALDISTSELFTVLQFVAELPFRRKLIEEALKHS